MKPIFLIGEAQGENEARINRGFVGATGAELLRMLAEAGVIEFSPHDSAMLRNFWATRDPWALDSIWEGHPELFRTNVFQLHPPSNKLEHFCGHKSLGIPGYGKLTKAGYALATYHQQLDRLGDEILSIDPNLIVCLGNTAIWALMGSTGVTKLRGTTAVSTHCVRGYKLLFTYHPSAVHRQWELRPTVVADLSKILDEKDTPNVARPKVEIWTEPTIEDIQQFIQEHVAGRCEILSVDIETSGTRVTCIGFAPRRDLALVIPFDDERAASRSYWGTADAERQCWRLVRSVLEDQSIRKVFQNGLYDIAFLIRSYGIKTRGAMEDTMLLHHALQPESLKGLGYLGSIYTNHGPWKHERKHTDTIKRDE